MISCWTCIQGRPAETRTPKHGFGRSLTAPPPVIAQQYSPATFASLRFQSRKEKFFASCKNLTIYIPFFTFFKTCVSLKPRNLKFRKSGSVCIGVNLWYRGPFPVVSLTTRPKPVAYPGILFGGRGSTNSVEDRGQRERGCWGCEPPSQGFWRQLQFGTRNFIPYSKIFLISDTLRLFMMTTNLSLLM